MATADLERTTSSNIDLAEAPSREWGWHSEKKGPFRAAGIVVAIFLLGMMIGNHRGHVEDIFLIVTAVIILGFIARSYILERGKWKN